MIIRMTQTSTFTQHPASPWPRLVQHAPWLVLLAALFITFYFWSHARELQRHKLNQTFEFHVAKVSAAIENRIRSNEQILYGVAGLFAASEEVDRKEFSSYVNALQIERNYPGIQGIGFAQAIPAWELSKHIKSMRSQGFPDYVVRPDGERERYSAIVFLEPLDWRNKRAFGFDMYTEPVRQVAMARARSTGNAALTGKVKLLQETEKDVQNGTLLYVPIYNQIQGHETLPSDRGNFVGWAYSPLRMKDWMESLLQQDFLEIRGQIGLMLYSGSSIDASELLFQSQEALAGTPLFELTRPIEVAGQTWTLYAYTQPAFITAQKVDHSIHILLAGLVISLLLAALAAVLQRGQVQLQQSEKRYRTLTETMQDVAWTLDTETLCFTYCSPAILQLRGITAEELIAAPLGAGFKESTAATIVHSIKTRAEQFANGTPVAQRYYIDEIEQPCKNGSLVWTEVVTHYYRDADTGHICLRGITRNINERKQNDEERRIAAVAFESHESTVVTDLRGIVIRANQAFTHLNGYEAQEIIGRTLSILHSGRHDAVFYQQMWQTIHEQGFWQGEVWNRRKDGQISPQWLTITAVLDDSGQTTHYVGSSFDISQRVAMESEIRNMAFYDALTGLANRRLLSDRLGHAFAKSSRKQNLGAVIYIDLDHFKELNDHLGHAEGDRLLILVADRLSTNVREGDTVARLGGDEFLVLLEDLSDNTENALSQASTIAEKLRQALNLPYLLQGSMPDDWQCTPSIGIALFSDHRESMDTLLRRADRALYTAKHAGRNTIRIDELNPAQN